DALVEKLQAVGKGIVEHFRALHELAVDRFLSARHGGFERPGELLEYRLQILGADRNALVDLLRALVESDGEPFGVPVERRFDALRAVGHLERHFLERQAQVLSAVLESDRERRREILEDVLDLRRLAAELVRYILGGRRERGFERD